MSTCSIVIPVYNSQESLRPLIERLAPVLAELCSAYEVILVNDASRDQSWQVVSALAAEYEWLYGINLMRNFGQHNALLCGIRAAQYELIITMDDDLQHPPEELHLLFEKLAEGYDVVYGTPAQEQHGFLRDLASQITKLALQNAMGVDTARRVSALRIFRTQVRNAFATFSGPYVSIDVLLTWGTTRFTAITVRHDPRTLGTSNYTLRKLITHTLNMMTGFSVLPLQLASLMGFGLSTVQRRRADLGHWPISAARHTRSGLSLPGLDYRHLLRRAASGAGSYRRIPGAHAFSTDGQTQLCRPRNAGCAGI